MPRTRHAIAGVLVILAALTALVGGAPPAPAGAAAPQVPTMTLFISPDVPSTVTPMSYSVRVATNPSVGFARVYGKVQFYVDDVPVGAPVGLTGVNPLTSGTAFVQAPPLAEGARTVRATFTPDFPEETAPTQATETIHVERGSTTTFASHEDIKRFDTATITALVSPVGATGTVQFYVGRRMATALGGPVTLVDGRATVQVSDLPVGPADITAVYSGDAAHLGSTSEESRLFYVRNALTTITATASPQPAVEGQGVVISGQVAPTETRSGQTPVTGAVTLRRWGVEAPTVDAAVVNGTFAFPAVTGLPVGEHDFGIQYAGNDDYSNSNINLDDVQVVAPTSSTVALSIAPEAPGAGDDVTVTATVAPAGATGTVVFSGAGGDASRPVANGTATLTLDDVAPGPLSLGATYSGDATHAGASAASLAVVVAKHVATVAVAPAEPPVVGQGVPLQVTVSSPTSGADPAGQVTVTVGSQVFPDLPLTGGQATTPPVTAWVAGANPVSVAYGGDDLHRSTVAEVQVTALTTTQAAVAEGYTAVLGRPADAAGAAHWAALIDGGSSLEQVLDQIARTAEGRGLLVDLAFTRALVRRPDAASRTYWADRVRDGMTAEDLLATLLGSDEGHRAAGGTPAGFVAKLAATHLGRSFTGADLTYWQGQAAAATTPAARRTLALRLGRTGEATTVAVRRALSIVCGTSTTTPTLMTTLGQRWAAQGRHPLRLNGAVQALVCRPGGAA